MNQPLIKHVPVTADTVTREQIEELRRVIRTEVIAGMPSAEQHEIVRCCNVALDRRFRGPKAKAAFSNCADVINARAKAVK